MAKTEDIPSSQVIFDSKSKREKLLFWMEKKNIESLILARRENFSWITTGGDGSVVNSTDQSVACLLFTPSRHYLISHVMDGERIINEQISGQDYELVTTHWYDLDPISKALQMSGSKIAADIHIPNTQYVFDEIVELHYPMKDLEMNRLRWLGQTVSAVYSDMCKYIDQTRTEIEIGAQFQFLLQNLGISSDVVICGADERIFQYRHPMPTEKKLNKYLMLHTAARKWGLHAPITRLFSIGNPNNDFLLPFFALASIQADLIHQFNNYSNLNQILEVIKSGYEKYGYKDEWKNHFQGGPTGYIIVDGKRCLTNHLVSQNTPFEWFLTVPGSKIAELILFHNGQLEIASSGSPWPNIKIERGGASIEMPGFFIL